MTRIALEDIEQLNQLSSTSDKKTIIFKHSTACPISSMMLKSFEKGLQNTDVGNVDYFYLDIFCYRHISNEIEQRFDVRHESPQLLVIDNGEVVAHASHSDISSDLVVSSGQ